MDSKRLEEGLKAATNFEKWKSALTVEDFACITDCPNCVLKAIGKCRSGISIKKCFDRLVEWGNKVEDNDLFENPRELVDVVQIKDFAQFCIDNGISSDIVDLVHEYLTERRDTKP